MSYNIGDRFVSGVDRLKGEKAIRAHLYDLSGDEDFPLCPGGYNRPYGFSILRGWRGKKGICKHCLKKADKILKREADEEEDRILKAKQIDIEDFIKDTVCV